MSDDKRYETGAGKPAGNGEPGTIDQKPRWEGPPELRPRGYLPAIDDPKVDRDAAGQNLQDPDRSSIGDALTQKSIDQTDHSNHVRLRADELIPSLLQEATIYGPGDSKIGAVSHIHGSGVDAEVVIDVGGFLGIGAKPVAVPVSQLDFMRDENDKVHAITAWTKDQLKEMPEHKD